MNRKQLFPLLSSLLGTFLLITFLVLVFFPNESIWMIIAKFASPFLSLCSYLFAFIFSRKARFTFDGNPFIRMVVYGNLDILFLYLTGFGIFCFQQSLVGELFSPIFSIPSILFAMVFLFFLIFFLLKVIREARLGFQKNNNTTQE